jgi:hypothetical protein
MELLKTTAVVLRGEKTGCPQISQISQIGQDRRRLIGSAGHMQPVAAYSPGLRHRVRVKSAESAKSADRMPSGQTIRSRMRMPMDDM